jgi:ABC-type Fe3+-siderophore transport system permease subunit
MGETKKISVLVPADLMKELDDISKAVKEADKNSDSKTAIRLEATPDQESQLTELRKDMESYQRLQVAEWHTAYSEFMKSSELPISFYEKLILLAGGSFALSLTFLAALQRHTSQNPGAASLSAMGKLKASWVLLLICIVLSWLHNLHRFAALSNFGAIIYTNVMAQQRSWESNYIKRSALLFKGMESESVGFGDLLSFAVQQLADESSKQKGKRTGLCQKL